MTWMPWGVALSVALLAFAGCAEPTVDDVAVPAPAPNTFPLHGVVLDTEFTPLAGARIDLAPVGLNASAAGDGTFTFADLEPGVYFVKASLDGYEAGELRVGLTNTSASVEFQLRAVAPPEPVQETTHWRGHLQCAAEYVIISGSCDAAITSDRTLGADPVFSGNDTIDVEVHEGWQTVVVDVVFDAEQDPGIDGLRVLAQGARDTSEVLEYDQYGRFQSSTSFTFQLAPGGTYPDGEKPVPMNATTLRFQVLPHSHGWHAACAPDGTCLLGLGAAVDLDFELFVTTFYVEPAPLDWTLQA